MNNLKHGRYAKRLPEKLAAAGDNGGATLYEKVRGEIETTFQAQPDDPRQMRQLDRMTVAVWCVARRVGINGLKPRSPFFSNRSEPPQLSILPIRLADHQRRVGITYWVQRKRYWTPERVVLAALNQYPVGVPTLGEALEEKLRHRVFRLGRPGGWDRLRYGLDENGNRTPSGPEGVRLHQTEASLEHAKGADGTSITGGSGCSNPIVTNARSILAHSLAKLLGGR